MSEDDEPADLRSKLGELHATAVRRIAGLRTSFDDIVQAASDVATDDEHDPEGHTIAWERQQTAALIEEANQTLLAIDAALERLDHGSYGLCTSCGLTIAAGRLEALPATATCLDCAG